MTLWGGAYLRPPRPKFRLELRETSGVRHRGSLSAVAASIGGMDTQALHAGPQGALAGLDQVNLRLSRQLAGRGELAVSLNVEGRASNTVRISIR